MVRWISVSTGYMYVHIHTYTYNPVTRNIKSPGASQFLRYLHRLYVCVCVSVCVPSLCGHPASRVTREKEFLGENKWFGVIHIYILCTPLYAASLHINTSFIYILKWLYKVSLLKHQIKPQLPLFVLYIFIFGMTLSLVWHNSSLSLYIYICLYIYFFI